MLAVLPTARFSLIPAASLSDAAHALWPRMRRERGVERGDAEERMRLALEDLAAEARIHRPAVPPPCPLLAEEQPRQRKGLPVSQG